MGERLINQKFNVHNTDNKVNIINPYRFSSSSIYDDATFLHSLVERTSNSTYCLRVKRSSDSTELDIGFSSGFLDTSALLTFVGAGNGIVTRLYNQGTEGGYLSGTANNLIVTSGSLEVLNGKACIVFDGVGVSLTGYQTGTCSTEQDRLEHGYGDNYSEVIVCKTTNTKHVVRGVSSSGRFHFFDGRRFRHNSTQMYFTPTEDHTNQVIMGSSWSKSSEIIRVDYKGTDLGTQSSFNGDWSCNGFAFGYGAIKLQEHVVWSYNAEDTSTTLLGDMCDDVNTYWGSY